MKTKAESENEHSLRVEVVVNKNALWKSVRHLSPPGLLLLLFASDKLQSQKCVWSEIAGSESRTNTKTLCGVFTPR